MSKIVEFLAKRGESEAYCNDAMAMMAICVLFENDDIQEVLLREGIPASLEYKRELGDYIDDKVRGRPINECE